MLLVLVVLPSTFLKTGASVDDNLKQVCSKQNEMVEIATLK